MKPSAPDSSAPGPASRGAPVTAADWARVRLFAMDVDGILTDGTVFIASDGTESKQFCVLDGLGLKRLRAAGMTLAWISGRHSGATTHRATELGIPHLIQGRPDKGPALQELASALDVPWANVAYMGDDDIDVPALLLAGVSITVPTAMPPALRAARYVTTLPAGRGAVREICDHLLAARAATAASP